MSGTHMQHLVREAAAAAAVALVAGGTAVGGSVIAGAPDPHVSAVSADQQQSPAPSGKRTPSPAAAGEQPRHLVCPNDLRSSATYDAFPPEGSRTPAEVGQMFIDPSAGERIVVDSTQGPNAVSFVLRREGSARAQLDLRYAPDTGWYLNTFETCADQWLAPQQ